MKKIFFELKPFWKFILLNTLLYGLLVVTFNYSHFPVSGFSSYLAVASHWLLITLSSGVLLYIIALNRWVFSILFPFFVLFTGVIAYYIFQYDITINTALIESTLNTNNEEVLSQISIRLLMYILVLAIVIAFFVYKRMKLKELKFIWIHILIIAIGLLAVSHLNSSRNDTIYQRNPFSLYLGLKRYQRDKVEITKYRKDISNGAICKTDSLTVVIVIGEALRADHVSLNGYKRETFPEMRKVEPVSFKNIYSEWTYTFKSVPHMLTKSDSVNHIPSIEEKSFISIFKACKFKSCWIGNQDLSLIALPFAKECDTFVINKPFKSDYSFTGKYDGDMLPYIRKAFKKAGSRKLIVIQQVGCHWWYPSYYPKCFEKFKPVIQGKSFSYADKQKIINAYDNAASYTDYFLSQVVSIIKNDKSIMIYLSDHGELLGEDNKWLHGQDTKYEKNPACILWFSDSYTKKFPEKFEFAKRNKDKRFRSDFLFHTALDAGEIKSPYFVSELSLLK